MEITIERIAKKKTYTIGRMTIDGEYFCDTLEPTWRDIGWGRPGRKIPGKTAVPNGRYAIAVSFSPKFKKWLPLLLGVPMFSGIRIHSGYTPADTEGCILVGDNKAKGTLYNSKATMQRLMRKLASRPLGEGIWITIE
ncbi:MAG: DUF5675 family protein [Prevotellaceae bacterium]|nr:DUF5675 family protein [Prevotellaceae bacterium]